MAKSPKSKLKTKGKEFLSQSEKRNQQTKIKMKKFKKWKENPSFKIQTLTRMVIPMFQQHEVKENNHVIIPSYVEI